MLTQQSLFIHRETFHDYYSVSQKIQRVVDII